MVTEDKSVIKSIRGDKEVFQRLADLAKEKGMQQGAALEALLNAWDIQNAKGLVPERAADIADFDAHLQGIQKAFLRSLDLASSAEDRARVSYSAQLDAMSGTVARLEKELSETRAALDAAARTAAANLERAKAAEKRVAELEKAQTERNSTEAILKAVETLLQEQGKNTAKTEKSRKSNGKPKESGKLEMDKRDGTKVTVDISTGESKTEAVV